MCGVGRNEIVVVVCGIFFGEEEEEHERKNNLHTLAYVSIEENIYRNLTLY